MSKLKIIGGSPLYGSVRVHGAKNSCLPILAAALISGGETVIQNCPRLSDVDAAIEILRHLGCKVEVDGGSVFVDAGSVTRSDVPDELMRRMRSSVIFLGAILCRCGEATLSMPGGCELGPRPIDLHLKAIEALGAKVDERGGNLILTGGGLRGGRVDLSFPSVGATENAMIAACGAEGATVITNAAREPEIRDLADYLTELGNSVTGAGSSIISITGGGQRKPNVCHRVIPDRIVAATYLSAAAAAGGDIEVTDVMPSDLESILNVLSEMGCEVIRGETSIALRKKGRLRAPRPITTKPYPGFPTDAQPPIMAASLLGEGTTVFVETIFESRFRHVSELRRMGADIRLDGRVSMVSGVKKLHGCAVEACDLRGGAALTVAALAAEGESIISGTKHIKRGYDGLEEALRGLGAQVITID